MSTNRFTAWSCAGLAFAALTAAAQETLPTLSNLSERVAILEQQLARAEQASASSPPPVITAGPEGFALTSHDKAFQLKMRGYVQTDSRFFLDDDAGKSTDAFVVRRVRPIWEGKLYRDFDYRIMPDFGGGSAVLQDAYLGYTASPAFKLRAGKYRPPLGLENLQSSTDLMAVERGLPLNLVPVRDVGLQLYGDLLDGSLSYAAGVFNGVPDGASGDGDSNDAKDAVGRLLATPFRTTDVAALKGLTVGIAASAGDQDGTPTSTGLSSFKTVGQQTFFSYRSSTNADDATRADGNRVRVSPQALYYYRSLGLLAEYVRSEQDVTRGPATTSLANEAWQIAAAWVLTGESASYKGVTPDHPFAPAEGHWGAFELTARYGELTVDDAAFPELADISKSARAVQAWGVGLNWYLNRNLKAVVDYDVSTFDGGAPTGDRPDEQALFTRLQVAF
ncbi:MAG: OprO/OprP family phosphate-selective porin [Lentisphaerae bacterium]|nr:OprO/OprP family phosphate-selective porin [Lentisphaerota bacterium]